MKYKADQKNDHIMLLSSTLDAYGGDMARWPSSTRLRLADFVAQDDDAQRLLREARALDSLLDLAPSPKPDQIERLTVGVMAKVQPSLSARKTAARAAANADAVVIEWPGPRPRHTEAVTSRAAHTRAGTRASALALLAASLVVGVFIGSSDVVKPFAQHMVESVGLAAAIDTQTLALLDEQPDLMEWEAQ